MENKIPLIEEKYISKAVVEDMIDEKIAQISTGSSTQVYMGQTSISGGNVDTDIVGVPFRPKYIFASVSSDTSGAWGQAMENADGSIFQKCMYAAPYVGTTETAFAAEGTLFRFTPTSVGRLVKINNNGFTVRSNQYCNITFTCIG